MEDKTIAEHWQDIYDRQATLTGRTTEVWNDAVRAADERSLAAIRRLKRDEEIVASLERIDKRERERNE